MDKGVEKEIEYQLEKRAINEGNCESKLHFWIKINNENFRRNEILDW
jgi:hypothetical protein